MTMGAGIMKRIRRLSGVFAALLVLLLLAGCGGNAGCAAVAETQGQAQTEASAELKEITEAAEPEETSTEAEEKSEAPEPEKTPEATETTAETPVIDENGTYTSKDEVALYIHTYGKLPSNYIAKDEAEELGWKKKQGEAGQLQNVAPGKSIGGSRFGNYEGQLPDKKGRKYFECDINYVSGNRGAERIIYSNDGLIFYTGDHYETFEQLYPKEEEP